MQVLFLCVCLRVYRYDVFELEQPMLQYNITLSLLEFNGIVQDTANAEKYVNWTTVSTFYLNPSQTMSRSKNGRVCGRVQHVATVMII